MANGPFDAGGSALGVAGIAQAAIGGRLHRATLVLLALSPFALLGLGGSRHGLPGSPIRITQCARPRAPCASLPICAPTTTAKNALTSTWSTEAFPDTEVYVVNVSFAVLKDAAERDYLNQQPTSFALPAEAVDRLRNAADTILRDSPEFRRFLDDIGAKPGRTPEPTATPVG